MPATLYNVHDFDDEAIVTISYVDPPTRGWWKVSDSQQRVYATKSDLVAALADQYRMKGWPCRLVTVVGFPNRELIGIARAEEAL